MTIDWTGYLHWRPAFAAAMDPRLYTADWLDARVAAGEAWFQSSRHAAIVAELRHYPTGACDLHGLVAAGDMVEIRDFLIPMAEVWGRSKGCIGAIIESRPGWARALAESGYAPHQMALRKDLS